MGTNAIEIKDPTKNDLDKLTQLITKVQDEMVKYINELSIELGVSENCAADVYYLRSGSRWTSELENELIDLHLKGTPPKITEFG